MLLTGEEKLRAWRRLKSGHRFQGAILEHTMSVSGPNLRVIKEHAPSKYIQARAAYRMVERGVIDNAVQFDRIAKELLR